MIPPQPRWQRGLSSWLSMASAIQLGCLMLSLPSLRLASAESRLRCSRHAWVTGGNVSLLRLTALRPLLLYASDEVSGLRCL